MDKLEIKYISVDDLEPYEKNAKLHTEEQIEQIKESIKQFGMNDPIGVWKGNSIIEGHGRLIACKELGYTEVPIIRLEHMTDTERKAYILAHNKLTMNTDFDIDILTDELEELFEDIDMTLFGFDEIFEDEEEPKHNERERTDNAYNLDEFDEYSTEGFYQMPMLHPVDYVPKDIIGFNYALTTKDKESGIHFYIDDYQFERVWNQPQFYLDKLEEFDCIFTPDFSLYKEMPIAMKIWNTYRSRLIGQMAQRMGMIVIPTVSWCEEDTFEFCFDGLPKKATLSISTIGVKKESENFALWKNGVDEMIKRLQPKTLLIYGGAVDYDFGKIKTVYFDNKVTERMKNAN